MAATTLRDLEHRFDVDGRVYVAQVCSPDAHSAAPLSAGHFDVHITTVAGKNVSDFVGGEPGEIAKAVVTSVARLVPGVSVDELDRFEEKVLAWVREHHCHGGEQLRTQ